MSQPYCVLFAGVVGSSKTPAAYYVSQTFGLPIFNNDAIRSEVIEDCGYLDESEQVRRRNQRLKACFKSGRSFILDASIDREWAAYADTAAKTGYAFFVASYDLSQELLTRLHQAKGYTESLQQLEVLMADHQRFLTSYSSVVQIHITDQTFPQRLELISTALTNWLRLKNITA